MFTLTVKWLSGDLSSIQIEEESIHAFDLIPLLTEEPIYKVILFLEGEKLSHSYIFTRDCQLDVLVRELPSICLLVNMCAKDYYIDICNPYEIKEFCREEVSCYSKILVDYLSYNAFFDMDSREKLIERLGITPSQEHSHVTYREYVHFCDTVFLMMSRIKRIEPIRFEEYVRLVGFQFMLPLDIIQLVFPMDIDLVFPTKTKKSFMLQVNKWNKWFAVKGKGKTE